MKKTGTVSYTHLDVYKRQFEDCGIDPDFYTIRPRETDELFPWDFIDAGVTKEFLIREWETARSEVVTPNCRERCSCLLYTSIKRVLLL